MQQSSWSLISRNGEQPRQAAFITSLVPSQLLRSGRSARLVPLPKGPRSLPRGASTGSRPSPHRLGRAALLCPYTNRRREWKCLDWLLVADNYVRFASSPPLVLGTNLIAE